VHRMKPKGRGRGRICRPRSGLPVGQIGAWVCHNFAYSGVRAIGERPETLRWCPRKDDHEHTLNGWPSMEVSHGPPNPETGRCGRRAPPITDCWGVARGGQPAYKMTAEPMSELRNVNSAQRLHAPTAIGSVSIGRAQQRRPRKQGTGPRPPTSPSPRVSVGLRAIVIDGPVEDVIECRRQRV